MAGGGGQSGGVESYLPVAAALAATVMTDGAASPWLVEAMGSEAAAGAVIGAGAGALGGGITAAVTGQDVGRNALMGGLGGATLGYGMAPAGAVEAPVIEGAAPALTGNTVAGTAATTPNIGGSVVGGDVMLPDAATRGLPYSGSGIENLNAMNSGDWWAEAPTQVTSADMADINNPAVDKVTASDMAGINNPAVEKSGGIGKWLSDNKGLATLGTVGVLGTMIQSDNKKYGVPSPASQNYNGPLSQFHYDRTKYTPVTTPQPNPAYQPQYANYVKNPYNANAAEGGEVHSYADGGLLQNGPANIDFMGGDMYPQSQQQRSYYATPTQAPTGAQQAMASYEPNTNPLTGEPTAHMAVGGIAKARRYDEGGTAQAAPAQDAPLVDMSQFAGRYGAPQAAQMPTQAPSLVDVGQLAGRYGMNEAQAQPQGIAAAMPYTAPSFTRPTNVGNMAFQNPGIITGTKAYNDRMAAEAQAQAEAEAAAAALRSPYDYGSDTTGTPGAAGGGVMKSYAPGGKITNHMAAIDDYVAQYQSDPASVTAKAKSGDWNAMIALNKINKTPNQNYAAGGGVGHLGGYAAGGNPRLLKGPGDGMSDNIPATIGGKQPARLADGEFVVPADVVSHLGNGSTDAGAKRLYNMMDKVRKARTGNKKQGKEIKADKYLPK